MEHHGGGLFFGAGPASSRRGSHAHSSQPTSEYGGYDEHEPDEQAMERSRVQLVSSRRKPSHEAEDLELDLYRSSFASNASSHNHLHHLYQQPFSNSSTSSASHVVHNNHFPLHASLKKGAMLTSSYIEAMTPDYKKPGVKKKTRSKNGSQPHGAFTEGDVDSRRSLPALDSNHTARKSVKYKRREESGEHSSRRTNGGGHDEYFSPGSPIMSSTMSSKNCERLALMDGL